MQWGEIFTTLAMGLAAWFIFASWIVVKEHDREIRRLQERLLALEAANPRDRRDPL